MDEVERQVSLAEAFFAEAKARAEEAKKIDNLSQYMTERLYRLIDQIGRIDNVKGAIEATRSAIPDGAIEAERERTKHGSQQGLI